MKTIAVYGSSAVQPTETDYNNSYDVGKALGQAGYAVMTGGYAGVMEAASKGAAEVGGHVIGVTTDKIEAYREDETKPNKWLVDEIRHPTLRERLMHLVLEADGYVIMPGGLGTLHELITVWELMRVGDISTRPLICYGEYWRDMLNSLHQSPYIKAEMWDMLIFVDSVDEVLTHLNRELLQTEE